MDSFLLGKLAFYSLQAYTTVCPCLDAHVLCGRNCANNHFSLLSSLEAGGLGMCKMLPEYLELWKLPKPLFLPKRQKANKEAKAKAFKCAASEGFRLCHLYVCNF